MATLTWSFKFHLRRVVFNIQRSKFELRSPSFCTTTADHNEDEMQINTRVSGGVLWRQVWNVFCAIH